MTHMTLRQARQRRKYTQKKLEALSGVDQAVISKLESGRVRNPGIEIVRDLEAALRVRPGTLVFGDAAARITKDSGAAAEGRV